MQIQTLFDPSRNIYRTIEKVITYGASQSIRLKAEISDYIVTQSIEAQFERLLSRMQAAMDQGGENEVGVWVSGFYGSGKSSFTKYLGLALDDQVQVDGIRFQKHLLDRLNRSTTKALLSAVASRYPAAVVLLDLASEMLAGATMEDVSTVLYYKVLQWAGYSRNLKVAALERKLKKDNRYEEFLERIEHELHVPWSQVQNDPLVIDSLIPEIAHALYPQLFKSSTSFTTETTDFVRFENERVKEMLDIAREKTGKQNVLFIVDEVGQYVGGRPNLILNLDGLAKNLKHIGGGRAWIIGTAQQTLTEDDPRAALNSTELYKLKDRFPIQIDLESSDIKEICTRRLLGKSESGAHILGQLFDTLGPALRQNTRLQDAKYYDGDFDRPTFINLYPFLPAHFDVLLHLLGALARTTGGVGLRSAIKVIQDILIEGPGGQPPVAHQPVGWLATSVTLYDALEKDIRRAFPSIHKGVGKATIRFSDQPLTLEVARTVAILQILGNMPVTAQNVTSLMHPAISSPSRREQVDLAIKALIDDSQVPFVEKENQLCFVSEKLGEIDEERVHIPLRGVETRRLLNEALRAVFTPLPCAQLHSTLTVTAGLKVASGGSLVSLAGENHTVQMVVELVSAADYDAARNRLLDETRQKSTCNTLFVLGRNNKEIDDKVAECFRCREINNRHRNDPDQEVRDYCTAQADRATRLTGELEQLLRRSLAQGSFFFRGQINAVESLDSSLLEAARKHLSTVAAQVFDRYAEAPVRAEASLAEKFLRAGNLKAITSTIDPLGLVQISGGIPQVRVEHKALISIRDYIERNGTVEGKGLSDHFTDAPFSWSQDTLRYLLAALLVAGKIVLKVSGREVKVNGQQALDALRTNVSLKSVGISLRDKPLPNEVLARAAARLTELAGDTIIPLEDDISKAASRYFPRCQLTFGPLAEKLNALGLPGVDAIRALNQELADLLLADASDAPQRLGREDSSLYDHLKWAGQVSKALQNGLETTVRELRRHRKEIDALPDSGIPGQLKVDAAEDLNGVQERLSGRNFHQHSADLNTRLTSLQTWTRKAALQLEQAQKEILHEIQQDLQRLPDWLELTQEEQSNSLASLETLLLTTPPDLAGLRQRLTQEYVMRSKAGELRKKVEQLGHKRRAERADEARRQEDEARRQAEAAEKQPHTTAPQHAADTIPDLTPAIEAPPLPRRFIRHIPVPAHLSSAQALAHFIEQLQALHAEATSYPELHISLTLTTEREG